LLQTDFLLHFYLKLADCIRTLLAGGKSLFRQISVGICDSHFLLLIHPAVLQKLEQQQQQQQPE
jgi:hypothetical protein